MARGLRMKMLLPQPRSRFLVVECPNCGHKQVIYSHATFPVRCLSCGSQLVKPTGGKAEILGKVEKILS
ncbi:MAG: 30S ribosomal protein S27e [Caldisphaeraceae archaeon]|nr:30S ribosomal protein S27e [Caldisphaeraceae archaeon]MEB2793761.1 30S ribosomal protein S27e [Caldisphaeraceae archaeon]MEB3692377.1 30S ribosomal protein S27e [Caldisphaeraceae archaeon]MEB3798231.1 30S ribosomal protein S27e [Caldisphaeraceae archaeon]